MRRSLLFLASLAGALVLSRTVPALADAPPKPSAAVVREAMDHDTRAAKLESAGLFERAETEYLEAFRAARRASDLQRVAEMQEKRGAKDAAADTYEDLATELPKESVGRAAARKLKTLERALGKVDVRVSETAASIETRDRADLTSPLAHPIHFTAGRHRLVIEKPGFERVARDVDVTAGETVILETKLEPFVATGHVVVRDTRAADVHVLIDGKDVGRAPWEGDVPPGQHRFELVGPHDRGQASLVDVARRSIANVDLTSAPTTGHLRFRVKPVTTQIAVDGASLPNRALETDLAAGDHLVVATADGYASTTLRVHVESGARLEENVVLARSGVEPDDISDANGAREARASRFRGGFFSLAAYQATTVSDTSIACSATTCSDATALGGGLRLGGGYAIGAFELELALAAGLDHRGHTLKHDATNASPAYDESLSIVAVRGIVGAGPRVRTPTQWLELDAGVVGGVAYAFYGATRDVTGGLTDQTKDSQSTFMPGGMADLKIVLGKTPGIRFALGFMAVADFPGDIATAPIARAATTANGTSVVNQSVPAYRLASGTEIFLGPTLGIVMGH